jgi:hypothetical protein
MTGAEATATVIDSLEALSFNYMLVGSLSSNLFGIPRSTKDADFVIQSGSVTLPELIARLGPSFRLEPQVRFETITMTTRQIVRIDEIPFIIEFFRLSDDPHDQERFRRRQRVEIPGHKVFVPTAEDIIITKLRWSTQGQRSKDADDARGIIAVQGGRLDMSYVREWCERHGTLALLDEIRRSIPAV